MIDIAQNENFLIGSQKDIEALSRKEEARIILISDSHGNAHVLEKIMLRYGSGCDGAIFCGDGLSDIYLLLSEARKNKELKKAIPPVMAIVQGNCDPSYYPCDFGLNKQLQAPLFQTMEAAGKKIFITHGHHSGVYSSLLPLCLKAQDEGCQCAVYGHTHVQNYVINNDVRIVNPGSCSNPRNGMCAGFAILTITEKVIDPAFIKIDSPMAPEPEFALFKPIF